MVGPYLMELSIRVAQPHFGTKPVILLVIGSPYRVVSAWLLMELNGYWHQVLVVFHIK